MWFITSSGRIELDIPAQVANACSHPGQCDADVKQARTIPYIAEQLAKIDAKLLADELREYGAWDDEQLAIHEDNLDRILWLACGDIAEQTN